MTVTFLAALLMQFVMIAVLRHRLGRHWLRRPVTVLAVTSVVYLGVAPALLAVPSIGVADRFRLGISRGYIDSADLIMSAAMLALALAYLLTRPERAVTRDWQPGTTAAARVLDWRWLALACVPLTLITAAGRGYNDGLGAGPDTLLTTNLVVTFFLIVVVVTALAFLLRHGGRWFLPVLIVQSVILGIAGERTPVLMNAIALIVVLVFAGVRVPGRQVACAGLLTVLVILSISGIREQTGRGIYYTDSGVTARVGALATGLSSAGGLSGAADSPGLIAQFAVRVSAVDYGGAILQAISEGQPRLSPGYVPQSLLLTVPSFLWPTKLSQGAALNPAQLQIADFGLQPINFIPGAPGLYLGILPPAGLATLFALLGAVFGWFERWLLRVRTPARMVLLAGAVEAALHFEGGLPTMLVQMRSAAVLALAVGAVTALRVPRPRVRSHSTVMPHPDPADLSAEAGGFTPLGRGCR